MKANDIKVELKPIKKKSTEEKLAILQKRSHEYQEKNDELRELLDMRDAELAALRERVRELEAAGQKAYLAMVAMGNDLNWDMGDYGYEPPYFFPVSFTDALKELKEALAKGGE